jgi:hypothetical protein
MQNIFVKPARLASGELALVRDPETGIPLDERGEWKAKSPFWTRRLRDADAELADPPAAPAEPSDPAAEPTRKRAK